MRLNSNVIYTGENNRILYKTPKGKEFKCINELNEEYDIDATVSDFNLIAERFIEESARTREELNCTLDVPYGPTIAERLDIFHGKPGGPIIIFIHGGYWKILTSKEFSFVARGLVEHGATVIIPTYALCPSVTIDEIVRQHRAVVAWTYNNAKNIGADPEKIVAVGHSVGGHGIAMLLETDWEKEYGLPSNIIRGGCAISGIFDLRPLPFTFVQPYLQLTLDQIQRNSPILNLPKSAPSLLVTYGLKQTSEFTRQSQDFYEAWSAAGLSGECWKQPDCNHFDELYPLMESNSELTQKIISLLE